MKIIKKIEDYKLKHILIEPLLFGDYRVGVWDENLNAVLDKEYFCRGELSALFTASEIQNSLGGCVGLPIIKINAEKEYEFIKKN